MKRACNIYIQNMQLNLAQNPTQLWSYIFLLFIDDLLKSISTNKLVFADDCKIDAPTTSLFDAVNLQNQLHIFQNWCDINNLALMWLNARW